MLDIKTEGQAWIFDDGVFNRDIAFVGFSSGSELIASASGDGRVDIWNTVTGSLHQSLGATQTVQNLSNSWPTIDSLCQVLQMELYDFGN